MTKDSISGSFSEAQLKEFKRRVDNLTKGLPLSLMVCDCGVYIPEGFETNHFCKEKYDRFMEESMEKASYCNKLEIAYEDLNNAALKLVEKIEAIHIGPYNGPTYITEIAELKALIDIKAAKRAEPED